MTGGLVVCAPLRLEAWALRSCVREGLVVHTGYGPARSNRSAGKLAQRDFAALAVAGLGGGLAETVASGDIVVANEIRGPRDLWRCQSAGLIAAQLRRLGMPVHTGPIVTTDHYVRGDERGALSRNGALAADMESAQLARAASDRPLATVRVVLDTASEPLLDLQTPRRLSAALDRLRHVGSVLDQWARAIGQRRMVVGWPRSFGPSPVNREAALRIAATDAELVFVAGTRDSHAAQCLVDTVRDRGWRAYLVSEPSDLRLEWLAGVRSAALVMDASAPPQLADELIGELRGLGPVEVVEHQGAEDNTAVSLPREVT